MTHDSNKEGRKLFKGVEYISLSEAATSTPYSQEYLSLLARRKKFKARKLGRNWYVTRDALAAYLATKIDENIADASQFSGSFQVQKKLFKGVEYISLSEAATSTPYSQEYLSLLARRKKFKARKLGRNWYVTRDALAAYLATKIDENIADASQFSESFPRPTLATTISEASTIVPAAPAPLAPPISLIRRMSVGLLVGACTFVFIFFFGGRVQNLLASIASFMPSGAPAGTMYSLSDIYGAIAGTFDASLIPKDQNGSLIQQLKYVESNLAWASSSTDIWNLNSGNVGIGTTTPNYTLAVAGTASISNGIYGSGLTTCSGNQFLHWDAGTGTFSCGTAADTSITAIGVRESSGTFSHITSISFDAGAFNISNTASESLVKLDYTNGPASRSIAQTIIGAWNFTAASNQFSNTLEIGMASMSTVLFTTGSVSGDFNIGGFASASNFYGLFTGNVVGNAGTATLLAANPSDCGGGQFAIAIDVYGNLGCSTPPTSSGGVALGFREGYSAAFTNKTSISFDAGAFNLDLSQADARLSLDYINGPASRAMANTWTALNIFSAGASVSTNLEVSGIASISQLTVGGVAFRPITSNSLDFDEFVASASLDSNFEIASGGYAFDFMDTQINFMGGVVLTSGSVGFGTTNPETKLEVVGNASVSALFGAGLTSCTGSSKLLWDGTTGKFSCGVDAGASGQTIAVGITGDLPFDSAGSISFNGAHFTDTFSSPEAHISLNWTNGPASRSMANTWTALNIFSAGASVSGNLEVSGTASVSQLYIAGSLYTPSAATAFLGIDFGVSGGTDVKITSISFDANMFDISNLASAGFVKLDWTNGPASRAMTNTWSALNIFGAGASFSNGEFTGYASASQYYGAGLTTCNGSNFLQWSGGTFGCAAGGAGGRPASDSLDWDEFANSMNLDANTTIASHGYTLSFTGNMGIGDTNPLSRLYVEGSTTSSGANAVGAIYASASLTNSTGSGFQFGNRFLNTVNGSVAGTEDGMLIRMTDNTTLTNTVRGLEVQAYSGTNTAGTNTGIIAFGKTIGIQGVTDALAGGVTQPAGVFADLDNGSAPTSGNALRAYTNNATSANLVQFYQETSAFSGTGLLMNFGNNAGSFTGKFLDLQKIGTSKMVVTSSGFVGIGTSSPTDLLTVASTGFDGNLLLLRDSDGRCEHNPEAGSETVACSSDERLKTDIVDATSALDYLNGFRVRAYTVRASGDRLVGVIAQELLETHPELVTTGSDGYLMVEQPSVWQLVKGFQELASAQLQLEESMRTYASVSVTHTVMPQASDILAMLADAAQIVVRSIRVTGDMISNGIKKTYFTLADLFPGQDIGAMVQNWSTRTIAIDNRTTADANAQPAAQSKVDLSPENTSLATYGVDSTRGEIQLTGTSELVTGEAKIFFDFSFTSIISSSSPIRVFIMPTTNTVQGPLYVEMKNQYGFIVKERGSISVGTFDWLVIARRKGYENASDVVSIPMPSMITPTPEATPVPTEIPIVTETPTPIETLVPTETPVITPEISPTPEVSIAPTPEPTITITPEVTATPVDIVTTPEISPATPEIIPATPAPAEVIVEAAPITE